MNASDLRRSVSGRVRSSERRLWEIAEQPLPLIADDMVKQLLVVTDKLAGDIESARAAGEPPEQLDAARAHLLELMAAIHMAAFFSYERAQIRLYEGRQQGHAARAAKHLEELRGIAGGSLCSPKSLCNLGKVLRAQGRNAEAIAVFREVMACTAPGDAFGDEAAGLISEIEARPEPSAGGSSFSVAWDWVRLSTWPARRHSTVHSADGRYEADRTSDFDLHLPHQCANEAIRFVAATRGRFVSHREVAILARGRATRRFGLLTPSEIAIALRALGIEVSTRGRALPGAVLSRGRQHILLLDRSTALGRLARQFGVPTILHAVVVTERGGAFHLHDPGRFWTTGDSRISPAAAREIVASAFVQFVVECD